VFEWENLKFWEIKSSLNFKYFNWNFFIFKILCLDKKNKIVRVKENEWKDKRRYDWCASKEKNIDAAWEVARESEYYGVHYYTWPQHSVNDARHDLSLSHRRATGAPLTGGCNSMCPYAYIRSMLCVFRRYFLKKMIIGVREESWVREERDFENFQVGEKMNIIKEIHECFERFFYQEENFNFSPFRKKLKFHIFSCLKF